MPSLSILLNDSTITLQALENSLVFAQGYDAVEQNLILLCLQLKRLYQSSCEYSQKRTIHGDPIINFPLLQKKLVHAKAMLTIYEHIIIDNKIDKPSVLIFVNSVLTEVLEQLLQIHGANGYMENSEPTQLWLDCRSRIEKLKYNSAEETRDNNATS